MNNTDYAGIEVSKNELLVGINRKGSISTKSFKNNNSGHKQLIRFLKRKSRITRTVMECTGVYGIEAAIELAGAEGIEIMLANPCSTRNFARALQKRNKNDKVDTLVLIEYAEKMPFRPYVPPPAVYLEFRSMAREIAKLTRERTRMKNRLHASRTDSTSSDLVAETLERLIGETEIAIDSLYKACMDLIRKDCGLGKKFDLIVTVKGIGPKSGIRILAELACLPAAMDKRQITAMAGLDPVEHRSGTSLNKRKGISRQGNKNLRQALYFPALVASRTQENVHAFYRKLLDRGKLRMVAIVAVMRKLLHSVWAMIHLDEPFDGEKFFRLADPST